MIKSFVYLDIDFSRDKDQQPLFPTKAAMFDGAPGHSLRATTSARPCGTIGRKRCTDVPSMNAGVRASPRFPNVNLYSVKRENKKKKKKETDRETERGRERSPWHDNAAAQSLARRTGNLLCNRGTKTYNGHNGRWISEKAPVFYHPGTKDYFEWMFAAFQSSPGIPTVDGFDGVQEFDLDRC